MEDLKEYMVAWKRSREIPNPLIEFWKERMKEKVKP